MNKKQKGLLGTSLIILIVLTIIGLVFFLQKKPKMITTGGDEIFTVSQRRGGGSGGGSSGDTTTDPDMVCEDCEAIWIEDDKMSLTFDLPVGGYVNEKGKVIPLSKTEPNPMGHWECRGPCTDGSTCQMLPILTPGGVPICDCIKDSTCHLEFGDLFCDRGLPKNVVIDYISGDHMAVKDFMINQYSENIAKIEKYIDGNCGIMKCDGTCPRNQECLFEWNELDFGVLQMIDCTCQDSCHKELNIFQLDKTDFINNVDNVVVGEQIDLNQWTNVKTTELNNVDLYKNWQCEGPCSEGKICDQNVAMTDCECREIEDGEEPEQTEQLGCSDIKPSGDSEWWKCLTGYCDSIPKCLEDGWHFNGVLVKPGNCFGCAAQCDNIGTKSEGWYDSCDGIRIAWDSACHTTKTCAYNTWSNSCECTGYTDECAWHIDYSNYPGPIDKNNIPYRYCEGKCVSIIDINQLPSKSDLEICKQTTIMDVGQFCDCVSAESADDETDIDDDGIPDNEDSCPSEPGTIENDGCPPVKILPTTIIKPVETTFFSKLSSFFD